MAAVETRVTGTMTLDLPGLDEPADGAVVSLPDDRPQQLHLLFLRRGRLPALGSRGEVVLGEAFAEANHFELGNQIAATIYGARQMLKIVGIGLSPEYVFEARAGETLPDNKRFGVFWMNERELANAFDLMAHSTTCSSMWRRVSTWLPSWRSSIACSRPMAA